MGTQNPKNFDHQPISLLIPERCTAANLSKVGSAATSSTYTEAGPRPGLPVPDDDRSRMQVEVSNAQGSDFTLQVVKGGNPGRRSCQVIYRNDDQASPAYRLWNRPTTHRGWIPIDWGASSERTDVVVIPETQKTLIAYSDETASNCGILVVSTDWSSSVAAATVSDGTDWNDPAMCVLADGERVLLLYGGSMYYTDDLGATLSLYSDAADLTTETTTNWGKSSMAVYRGDIILLVEDSTSDTFHHLASTDEGNTFTKVDTYTSFGNAPDCVVNEDGIHVVFREDSGNKILYRRLGTVFENIEDAATATEIDTGGTYGDPTITSDGGGTLYINYPNANAVFLSVSTDSGESWDQAPNLDGTPLRINNGADSYIYLKSAWCQGQLMLCHGYADGGVSVADDAGCAIMGAWGDVIFQTSGRDAFQGFGSGTNIRHTWHAFTKPDAQGWTATGAGTTTLASDGSMDIATSTNTAYYDSTSASAPVKAVGSFEVKVDSGTGSTTTQDVAVVIRLADASSYEYEAEILLKDDTVTINDVNGAGTSTISIDLTAAYLRFDWQMTQGQIKLAVSTPGVTLADDSATVTITDNGATANSGVARFGNIASATANSNWRYFHAAFDTNTNDSVAGPALAITGGSLGKAINSRPEPLPDLGDGTYAAHIAVVSGPARNLETFDCDVFYEQGIEACHAEVHRSPLKRWRSTDLTENAIVYDLGDTSWIGNAVAIYVQDANFRTCKLQSYNGASWDNEITLDLADGFTSLAISVSGDSVRPNTSTTNAAGRWLWEQELAPRGWVQDVASATNSTRILSQSSGGWTQTTTVIPVLRVNDPSKVSGVTSANLVWPTGLGIKHWSTVANSEARYWRVLIEAGTAGQDTPDDEGYWEAGIIAICRVQMIGAHAEWGYADNATRNARDTEDSRGTFRTRERGPLRRTLTMGWPNAEHWRELRLGPGVPGYWSPTSRIGNVGDEDVSEMIRGLVNLTNQGETPVIAVNPTPSTDGTIITDRTRFVYGALTSGVSTTLASGIEAESEDRRVETISITEIVG